MRDAAETRKKLLDAATDEFAARGIAGARVDRIAAMAGVSKPMIYSYFGSKDQLFDAVMDTQIRASVSAIPFDPDNLPDYAAALFDRYRTLPASLRLATWQRLERGGGMTVTGIAKSVNAAKVAALEAAQEDGRLPAEFSPRELLSVVLSLSAMWAFTQDEGVALPDDMVDRQREAVKRAVRIMIGRH